MTTLFNPVAGNESFSTVNSIASGSIVDGINTSVVQANNSSVGAQLLLELGPQVLPQNVSVNRLHKLDGYVPSGVSTLVGGAGLSLMNAPNLPAPTSITQNTLSKLPTNAVVLKVSVDNGGTTITETAAATMDIGTAATLNPAGLVTTHMTTAPLSQLNNGATTQLAPSILPVGGAGTSEVATAVAGAVNILTVVNGSGNDFGALSGLHVAVYYISPES